MSQLNLFLFGSPRVYEGDQFLSIRRRKGLALLAYLAITGQSQSREALATLLWPDSDQSAALGNLRRELSRLKHDFGGRLLDIDRLHIVLSIDEPHNVDVARFRALWNQVQAHEAHAADRLCPSCVATLTEAAALYTADFMDGFTLADCHEYDEWQFFEREDLRQIYAQMLETLLVHETSARRYHHAAQYGRQWLALDPLHEPAHRWLMSLYAWDDQQAAAVRQYEELVRILEAELGIAPEEETTALYEAIRTRRFPLEEGSDRQSGVTSVMAPGRKVWQPEHGEPPSSLPQPPTPFVGREEELRQVEQRLSEPDCQLLTLCGPGGIGKTRLALEVARRWQAAGTAVFFVDLQPVDSTEFLVLALLDALHLTGQTQEDPRTFLLRYLSDKEQLLLLDNFEYYVEGADLLSDIVRAAPGVKLLVTSRVVLNLQEEWLYPVAGLRFPQGEMELAAEEGDGLAAYDAVQLFVEHARRVQPRFELEAVQADVVRLCQLVDGMPLALQLAGSWVRTLPVWAIADEIESDLTFLATPVRNVPQRHRSMEVVFQRSWEMLTEEERRVFKRLSVFRASFPREAAAGVAGASLVTLAALVDKSLLRRGDDNRYQIHDLLRQFAAERLARDEVALGESYDAFVAYYARFLSTRFEDLMGARQREAMNEIAAELSTIRVAWAWAMEHERLSTLHAMAPTLGLFYRFQSRYQEGLQLFKPVVERLRAGPDSRECQLTLLTALVYVGWFLFHLGHLEESEAIWQESEALYRRLDIPPLPITASDPAIALSFISWIRGDNVGALRYAEQALASSNAHDLPANEQAAYYLLAHYHLFKHQPGTAERYAQQACQIAQERGDRWFLGLALAALGEAVSAQGDTENASGFLAETYTIAEEFRDYGGMAGAAHFLANIALRQGDLASALEQFRHSLKLNEKVDDSHQQAQILSGIADSLLGLGKLNEAAGYYRQAVEIAAAMDAVPLLLRILVGVSKLLFQSGQEETGQDVLSAVAAHPRFDEQVKAGVRERFRDDPLPALDGNRKSEQDGRAPDLEQILPLLLAELAAPTSVEQPVIPVVSAGEQQLVEPLTEREQEVMALIATGLTNREIAEQLFIALSTVKSHIKNIYGKMGVSNRVQAVARAQELELVEL